MHFFKTITLTLCVWKLRMECGCSSGKNGTGGCGAMHNVKANLRLRIWWESRLSRPFLHQLELILNPRISILLSARYPSEAHWTALFKQAERLDDWIDVQNVLRSNKERLFFVFLVAFLYYITSSRKPRIIFMQRKMLRRSIPTTGNSRPKAKTVWIVWRKGMSGKYRAVGSALGL